MNNDLLRDMSFEIILDGIIKIKNKNEKLIEKNEKLVGKNEKYVERFDECIDLLGRHSELNKKLHNKEIKQRDEIKILHKENNSLAVIIDDLRILNKDLEAENILLLDRCNRVEPEILLYDKLTQQGKKLKVLLTENENLKCENKELKKKQVFVFRALD